jgi:hypothetical protein
MKTQFDSDLYMVIQCIDGTKNSFINAKNNLKRKQIGRALQSIANAKDFLSINQSFLNRYEGFFQSIDHEFGTDFKKMCDSSKKLTTEILAVIRNVSTNVSMDKTDIAQPFLDEAFQKTESLESVLGKIATLPHIIDFSKLTNVDWRKIGVAGVHFRSKVFLSYPFRDNDPAKDENQKFMDYLIKPLLALFNIESVTARSHLHSQEHIEEDTLALVAECDGIIGFYTTGNPIENVEHELANNQNVIAVCKEEGANSPSMRRSRLQIDFIRNEPSQLLLQVAKALKEKEMFKLAV